MEQEKLTYDIKEIASLLGISRSSVYAQIALGIIPAFKIGRRTLIPKMSFQQMLERKSAEFTEKARRRSV